MDDPNITMEEYIRLEEEKARRRGKVYNWETATYGKIWDNEDVHDLGSVETEFPAIVFNDTLTSEATLSCEPTVSSLNDEIDFRISFDESDDEDCTVIFDKNSFSYKIISVNNLKTDSENDNDKVNMPSLPSPEPTVSCFDDLDFFNDLENEFPAIVYNDAQTSKLDDLDYFKDFENEFPAIVYNDAQTSKSDLLTEPILNPQHIDEFNLKDETSLSECDEEEQNVLNFNDLFPFNVIYPNDSKSDKDNDDDKVDIEHSSGDLSVKPLPDFQGNQRDYFLNDTFRGRSLVSSIVYYEVTPTDTFPLRHIFGGVTTRLLEVLQNHKGAIAWSIADIKGIDSPFCTHKILMEDEFKPSVQPQRQVNPNIKEVVKKVVIKLLDAGLIYHISDSPWVSLVQVVPKKGGMTVVKNEKDGLIPQWTVTEWRVCIDYRKLNNATQKDRFPLPFIDQMVKRLAGHEYYFFLNGFSGYFQIPIAPEDQEKTTFTCPYGTFTYKRMPFRLCNAPTTFQPCMTTIFHELIEDIMEVFMDDFSVFGSSFDHCLKNLEKMLKRCEETNLIHDKKGAKNLAVDHLSRLENPDLGKLTRAEIRDLFPEERLMAISDKNNEPCVLTESYKDAWPKMKQHKFFNNVTTDHPGDIMASPPPQGRSSKPDFMGPFPSSNGNKYILVAIDYISKWVEAQAFPTSDARNVVNFLRRLFAQFGITKALISDRGTHFCNYQIEKAMKRLFPEKLKSRWYGPFTVSKDMKNRAIELYDEEGSEFIVNKQQVKPYQKNLLVTNKGDDVTLVDEGEGTTTCARSLMFTESVVYDLVRLHGETVDSLLTASIVAREIPLKESLEAHAIRLAKKKGVKGKAILCGVGAAHIPRSDGVPVSVATVLPKDSELLGKLEEAGDAAYQVGRSEQSRCHSI
ncbi:reverse transcriptase domain-containing protein [Tanacetum coccineum]|uniref:Reverse transcriptase domain-containing protein n=1 Tax=Tanacetum coccineum TaxID=301880 RepID=A0ABQ4ZBF3_9ASTR